MKILSLLSDINVWLSGLLVGWSFAEIDLMIKVLFGLPPAIYMIFKIYQEFLKPKK